MSTQALNRRAKAEKAKEGDVMYGQHIVGETKEFEQPLVFVVEKTEGHDRFLVARAKSGHASAFGTLYERHRTKIYHSALRILRNRQDAEDAVQRSFLRALTNLARFREDSSFSTWVTRIAINEALMLLRQRRSKKELPENGIESTDVASSLELTDGAPTPEQALAQVELQRAVLQGISKLRHSLRVVVLLREVHGLTSAETARRLGLSVAAVKARTFHARRHLKRYFQRSFKGGRPISPIGRPSSKSLRSSTPMPAT
jgi:RNA polymerase sigma-70 factor (ECF subfamily)